MTATSPLCRSTPKVELYDYYIRLSRGRQEDWSWRGRTGAAFSSRLRFRAAVPVFLGHPAAPCPKKIRFLVPPGARTGAATGGTRSDFPARVEGWGRTRCDRKNNHPPGLEDVTRRQGVRSPKTQECGTLPTSRTVSLRTLRVRLDPYALAQPGTCATVCVGSWAPSVRGEMTRGCGRSLSSRAAPCGDCAGRYGPWLRAQGGRRPTATGPCRRWRRGRGQNSIVGRQYPKRQRPVFRGPLPWNGK